MIPPIFQVCEQSAAVWALIGGDHLRLYPFGEQDDDVIYPYAVWQGIAGSPENYLGNRPDVDTFTLQVDVYADTVKTATDLTNALRDAIEPHAYITRWGAMTRDNDTKRYRSSFDVDWMVPR